MARALQSGGAKEVSTLAVKWPGVEVLFESDDAVTTAVVTVSKDISIPAFAHQFERLLDCWAPGNGEWVVKWSDRISKYGSLDKVRLALCDRIVKLHPETGETVGALKRKRRSVKHGHGTVRLVPAEDSLQLVLRHPSAQGLKALWKSVFHRLGTR